MTNSCPKKAHHKKKKGEGHGKKGHHKRRHHKRKQR